ncbi:hypothetical protein NW755_006648 [Fusarium falciforme]|uniref:Uncharacterized protein n=1 Tax=Fusarium falciforme TaxID=195108 RepID=A0A9W8V2G9_9HYPO|nr:hypothetical protein NW755_006648 [Fusarium falciforme]
MEETTLKTEEEELPQRAEVPVNDANELHDKAASDEQSPKETGNEDEDEDEEEKEDYKAYSHPLGDDHRLGLEVVSGDENTSSVSYE